MKTKLTCLLGSLVALATAIPTTAQENAGRTPIKFEKQLSLKENQKEDFLMDKVFPMLKGKVSDDIDISPYFGRPAFDLRPALTTPPLKVNQDLEIWASFFSVELKGIYLFKPTNPLNPAQLSPFPRGFINGGSGLMDDELHGIYLDATQAKDGIYRMYHYAFDVTTWQLIKDEEIPLDYSLFATETAMDPVTGEVFGQFMTSDTQEREWGVIDYNTMQRTTIGSAVHTYMALGIANDGQAYGVADDGFLYKIDRTNGTEVMIGSTGVQVKGSMGDYYYQSGEIDPATNEFYWAAKDKTGKATLYTVNLTDAKLTEIAQLGRNTVTAMTIPTKKVANGAPAKISDLKIDFVGASTSGNVAFTAPTTTFGGSSLSGALTYSVTANGVEVASGSTTAGAKVTASVQVPEGVVNFNVSTSNAAGRSQRAKMTKYVGNDTPRPVTGLTFTAANNQITLHWNAPGAGMHNGYMGNITYDVYRYTKTDTTKVASAQTATTFSETLPTTTVNSYTYAVVAINATKRSEPAVTDTKVLGEALTVPFFDDFASEADSKTYTIINNNGDKSTWSWFYSTSLGSAFRYQFHASNEADDWLITPPIKLEAGKSYVVEIKARSGNVNFPERFEAKWGKEPTVVGMNQNLISPTDLPLDTYEKFEGYMSPTEDGIYHVAIHAISNPNTYYLYIGSISIEKAAETNAPAAVSELKATADPTGARRATITFKAPAKTVIGKPLTNIDKIEVKNEGRLVKSISHPAPGSLQTVIDESAAAGDNTYTVTAFNDGKNGQKESVKVFVGEDEPNPPVVKAYDNTTSVKLDWDDVTGINGGIIVPNTVVYTIYNITDKGELGGKIATVTDGTTEYTVNGLNTAKGAPRYKQWALTATNSAGTSRYGTGSLFIGAPYTSPFHLSFKDGTLENIVTVLEYNKSFAAWKIDKEHSVDNDGGCIAYRPGTIGHSTITTGKITLKGSVSPKLVFDYQATQAVQGKLAFQLKKMDGTIIDIWSHDFSSQTRLNEWINVVADIPDEFKSEEYFSLIIRAEGKEKFSKTPFFVDNINVVDPADKDAAVEIVAPEKVNRGQDAQIIAKVRNMGLEKLSNAKLKVTVNDKPVYYADFTHQLTLLQAFNITVPYRTTSLAKEKDLKVRAEIILDGDMETENNTSTAVIKLEQAPVLSPEDLKASSQKGVVSLAWVEPIAETKEVTETFEGYDAWATEFGSWTTIDVDKGYSAAVEQDKTYPHMGEQFAFINWRPGELFGKSNVDPHSGQKAAVAIYQTDQSKANYINSDNWLISPQLSTKAQTITFWVDNVHTSKFGNETFEVLASSTGRSIEDFTKVGETLTQKDGHWTEVNVSLPQGTRYFAIRHTTNAEQAFIFMIDDVKFEGGSGPVSYNIYRNGQLIGTTMTNNFVDKTSTPGQKHNYCVTAVYADGSESAPAIVNIVTGITGLPQSPAATYNVYTLDGKQVRLGVRDLRSLQPGVYIINGKKITIR